MHVHHTEVWCKAFQSATHYCVEDQDAVERVTIKRFVKVGR